MKNKIHCFVNHIYPRKLYVVITDSALFLGNYTLITQNRKIFPNIIWILCK